VAFLDEAVIRVASGKGGAGCLSFRRERYLPRGGPDGGNGGRGGDFHVVARTRLTTLYDALGGRRSFHAGAGQPGSSKKCHGRAGEDFVLEVPVGTVVRDPERGQILAELMTPDDPVLLLEGGKGGRGNWSFRNSRRRAPRITQPGLPGAERTIRLELKLLADVGLIGLPNAGKSTLLGTISGAKPKVGNYPFTTLAPGIGVVEHDFATLTVADLPGLLEGAGEGRGLGDRFLRHIERTRVLLHLVDASEATPEELRAAYDTVRRELVGYSPALANKPELVIFTKIALRSPDRDPLPQGLIPGRRALQISAREGVGIGPLVSELFAIVSGLQAA
jgi:GTP-binding protein